MQLFKGKAESNQVRFRAMMESGILVDEMADVVQTQVIAQQARASVRNRDAVPLYHHLEEGRPPVWSENLLVETGISPPPGMDSRYILEDSLNLWKGIKTGSTTLESRFSLGNKHIAILANCIAGVVFLACAWIASFNYTVTDQSAIDGTPPPIVDDLTPREIP